MISYYISLFNYPVQRFIFRASYVRRWYTRLNKIIDALVSILFDQINHALGFVSDIGDEK